MPIKGSSSRPSNKANIFLCPIEYELNSLLGCLHLIDYIQLIFNLTLVHVQNFGGWQAVSLGCGVTVMEKREILVGWVTKVCLKCTKKLG